jgi:aspartyl/asparaginyl beta-hydroxylase (cupin superfamily)
MPRRNHPGRGLEDIRVGRLRDQVRAQYHALSQTWRIVQKTPGLKTAMFSIFEPGKRLPPHRGRYNGVLRLHLGLRVPEPRASPGHPDWIREPALAGGERADL